ncbi:DUF6708 domain-containing protein [Stenotrophomonas sp. RAC2]|uniref:DUF6708 domain-containing protein n=1 Tax=Stenotrophomonas sp. RAC2 TaxID=3064902 RepID=UPI00271E2724|nr:DUF6708 domain-containing protein [Stenotrophomonas sp. RAC2]MDV9040694.1 DUF6708 domain-containing protein [Stenotrophomonas sp. RAC2]
MQHDSDASSTALRLPPSSHQASPRASTHGGVLDVYEYGISFVDQMSAMRGYASSCGWVGVLATMFGLYISFFVTGFSWVTILQFVLLLVFLLFIQIDWVGYRAEPVLFDRRGRKVHVFKSLGLPWWQWGWNIFGRPRYEVQSFDWDCVRAEVVTYTVFTGQVPRRESSLVLAISDLPGGALEVQRVGVGPSFGYGNSTGAVERWEFVRRMMEGVGPVWSASEARYQDFAVSLGEALTVAQPLIGPGSRQYWKKGLAMWLLGAVGLIALPLTAYIGLNRYLSYRLQRKPRWPPNVLNSVGAGPFTDAVLRGRLSIEKPTDAGRKRRK